jgi:predicted HicB family RNase H-like nuclease
VVTTTHILETRDSDARDKMEFAPMSPERAQAWLLEGDVEVFSNPFEDPPEAEAEEETAATVYTRMTSSLKRDVDAAAEKAGVSVNVWMTRCVEQCLKRAS